MLEHQDLLASRLGGGTLPQGPLEEEAGQVEQAQHLEVGQAGGMEKALPTPHGSWPHQSPEGAETGEAAPAAAWSSKGAG